MKISKEKTAELILNHHSFLQVGHVHADGDDIGSLCALHRVLHAMGKKSDMIVCDGVPERFRFLKETRYIRQTVPDHKEYDMIVFTDLSNIERGGGLDYPPVRSLCIDHHVSNTEYADFLYLRPDYAATAEMLAELFLEYHMPLDEESCNALYMGIATDSGFFKYSNTSEHTLCTAGKLVGMGARPELISSHLDAVTLRSMKVYQRVLSTLHFSSQGKIGWASMDQVSMDMEGDNSDAYVEIPRRVQGVELAVLLKYESPSKTRVSFRSQQYVDVSELAAQFGGGGHVRAAGCTVQKSIEETEHLIGQAAAAVI